MGHAMRVTKTPCRSRPLIAAALNYLLTVLALMASLGTHSRLMATESWPQFRGPNANGSTVSDFPERWDETKNVRWKMPIAGEGWSCPIVWGDQVILTAAVRTDAAENAPASGPEQYRGGGGR